MAKKKKGRLVLKSLVWDSDLPAIICDDIKRNLDELRKPVGETRLFPSLEGGLREHVIDCPFCKPLVKGEQDDDQK